MKQYKELTRDEKMIYLRYLEEVIKMDFGCPPEELRSNVSCFYCNECKKKAIVRDLATQ